MSENMISSDVRVSIESFEGIFFDLDGTLVDLHIEWNDVRQDMREAFMALCSKHMPDTGITNLINLALEDGCTNARQIAVGVLDKHESLASFDQKQEAIKLFKSMLGKKKIAVVTNNLRRTAERALKNLGLLRQDICIIGFDDVQHSKPHIEGIQLALQELHINKSQVALIGDRDSDKKAAYDAGIFFYHANRLFK
jgi:HAD superfamily hydrolase (TIGR01549 family)